MGRETQMMARLGSVVDQKSAQIMVPVRFIRSSWVRVTMRMTATTETLLLGRKGVSLVAYNAFKKGLRG